MTKLLAFHGDPAIKEKYVARMQAHINADELVRGQYYDRMADKLIALLKEAR